MTLDARALLAIVCHEPGWEDLVARVLQADHARVPATALAEAGMVLTAQDSVTCTVTLQDIVRELRLTIVPFTAEDWTNAVFEYSRRRRSSADRARFGDCLSAVVAARVGAKLVAAD